MYRYHVIVDDECKQLLDQVPAKRRSEFVREWIKKGANVPKEDKPTFRMNENGIPIGRVRR